MEGLIWALQVGGVLLVALLPIFGFLEAVDRWHERVWKRFAQEKGGVLTRTARGPFKYWQPGGPRKLEVRVAGTWVTLRYLRRAGFTKASTAAGGFPLFIVHPRAAVTVRGWGPDSNAQPLELGDAAFDSRFEVRSDARADLWRLLDEQMQKRHLEAPTVLVGTDDDGLLAAKVDDWGRDTSELSAMVNLLEGYLERNPARSQ